MYDRFKWVASIDEAATQLLKLRKVVRQECYDRYNVDNKIYTYKELTELANSVMIG